MESSIETDAATLYSPREIANSRQWCRNAARRSAKNFYYSFLALSGDKFHGMCALYAFLRVIDDIGDEPGITATLRETRLAQWQHDLERLNTDHLDSHPVWPALHEAQRRFGIQIEHLRAVIQGVQSDLDPVELSTFAELERYCYHVAGAVGFCCLRIWGTDSPKADKLAVDCGLAFQLTNILRDLKEDAGLGRIYLPSEELGRFGYSREELERGAINDAFRALMRFEVERARRCYLSAEALEGYLAEDAKPVFRTMFRIYRGILEEIPRREYDVFSNRVRLSTWSKSQIALSELMKSRWRW